ncbi:MAG: anaerobic sulfatase maturase [Syntrophothermus sp.]
MAFHLLAKPTGAICNLDCSYCFFLSKEALYPGSSFRMSEETLEQYLRQLIEAHANVPEVTIAWQGGEPTLMGLDFFRRSVELAEGFLRPGQRAFHTIQTNGTKIDAEWAAFFAENGFLVGISIDGPREVHDAYRVTKGGRGSFDQVMRGLGHLRRAGVEWNALATVHAANGDRALEVYRFLRDDCGARFMQFIPIVEEGAEYSVGAAQFGRFLIEVFDEWVRRDVARVFVQMFDVALGNWVGAPPALCVHAETCGRALAIEHTGDLYCCDHYVDPEHMLGNIAETEMVDLVESAKQRRFGLAKRDTLPAYCRRCDVRFACHGGCPKDRFIETPEGDPGLNYLCAGYKAFFHHVDAPMRTMASLLAQGRPPAEVMQLRA